MSGGNGGNAGSVMGGAGASVMPDGTAGTAGMGTFDLYSNSSGGGGGSAGGTGGTSQTLGGGGAGGAGGYGFFSEGGSGGSGGRNGAVLAVSGLLNTTSYTGGTGSNGVGAQLYFGNGYSAGGGGGGEGGFGLILTPAPGVTSFTNQASIQGGVGGLGGAGVGGGAAGLAGDGGVALDVVASGITVTNTGFGYISGGNGPYVEGTGNVANGGVALLAGSNLTLIDSGYLSGGFGAGGIADAVSFTAGANTIALGGNYSLDGGIAVATGASLTFDQTAGSFTNDVTLWNLIEGGGSIIKNDATVLDLANINTYTGGTTISAGTLALLRETSAGTGTIAFGSGAGETLRLDFAGTTAVPNTLVAPVSGFVVGDKLDLTAVNSNATVSYTGGVLTVSDGTNSDQGHHQSSPARRAATSSRATATVMRSSPWWRSRPR